MAKAGEKTYFKKIGDVEVAHSLLKPFSFPETLGSLLHDIAAVFSLLPKDKYPLKILDLGCGTGWTSVFMAKAGHQVTGVDISPDAIKAAKKHFAAEPNLPNFICSDYDSLPYENEFDVVLFFDSLHHSIDELDGLSAAYKSLRAGGEIILCEPGYRHSKHEQSLTAVREYGVNERDMPPKLSKKALKQVGFHNIKVYAYPAMVHRALYNDSQQGITKLLRRNNFMRTLTVGLITSLLLPLHGIVVARKP